ncbi:FecR domain-containing protein [Chitinophaga filiformis]|uniref:FecR domain-containing protein n=1 Tax=Chitinophaga filiformis TaxID=104663 RepID=UPI001F278657|nr:FecR domain-containing protein [Chitinophaga filiformis]MCF6401242.1 FecR domain-containing protein [Chitinophaga filiformis]
MRIDETQLEQLVLDELGGIISPEDSATLKKLLEEEPEALIIRNAIYEQFSGPEEQAFLALLPEHLPIEKVWAKIRKRKWIRVIVRSSLSLAFLASVASGIYISFKPKKQPPPTAVVHGLSPLKTVALQLPNGEVINLGSAQQHVTVGEVTLNAQEKQVSLKGGSKGMAMITVPTGQDYKIKLPDGTEVQLNAASKMAFPVAFTGNTREVTIQGEAYLKVATNPTKPFIVHLPNSTIQVLGTEFNVNTYDNAHEQIALIKGAIKLKADSTTLLLKPGFAVRYQKGQRMQAVRFDAEELLAWREGTYVFHATTIDEMCNVLKRWYGINIIYDNANTGQRRFTGYIDKSRPMQHFLDDLKFTGHFDYYFDNDSVLHIR